MGSFLVTGGCGFIGSHLCAALIDQNHKVSVLDNLSTGRIENLPPRATFIEGCVTDPSTVARALREVDGCFHLAAIASVEKGVREWATTHRTNLTGTITLFEAIARQSRPVPVVYASSAAVYGDCPDLPITETAERTPLSSYGADKYACELHARVANHVHGIPATGLRFFNVYGPRQDPRSAYSGVISIFADRLQRGQEITIFGDGAQTRDFVFVADVAAALMAAMARKLSGAPVFNVCTGVPTAVLDVARTIAELCGLIPQILFRPGRSGEIKHSVGNPARAASHLGLSTPTGLLDGLQATLIWLAANARSAPRLIKPDLARQAGSPQRTGEMRLVDARGRV